MKKFGLIKTYKFKCCKCVILCELEYRMPYYQGGCNISGVTLPKVLIAVPYEKNQRETLGSRKSSVTGVTGLTGPADRSDRSGSNG